MMLVREKLKSVTSRIYKSGEPDLTPCTLLYYAKLLWLFPSHARNKLYRNNIGIIELLS